jgi:hypothetical protein
VQFMHGFYARTGPIMWEFCRELLQERIAMDEANFYFFVVPAKAGTHNHRFS